MRFGCKATASTGISVSQLITDFGHQSDLIAASEAALRAEQDVVQSTHDTVLFKATQAYYDVLRAEALLDVARQTVEAIVAGREEVLADDISQAVKAALPNDHEALYPNIQKDYDAATATAATAS